MFDKILIANRGEIACRVIKTARRMGIKTVAVYSEADANARHVRLADEAVLIGPAAARESYLVIDKIIAAARQTGAQAIHPGYGFLSENEDFCHACEREGIVFIGPPVSAIRAMGSKSEAKKLMEAAGVPLTPGYHGDDQDPAWLHQQADAIGYPVLIKAAAGGGGKGMRLVDRSEDFIDLLASCKREAISSFGDDHVLVEKYITKPRHIEIQVFGDTHGNVVYLFERDCSVQRRHQKVLEEAPAPGMTLERRAAMGKAAVDAAKAVGYVGAGTVEFIANQDGSFYFMEMNTRLQVEHPVTEMITGLDLVEWQLRVASGEKLPLAQEQLQIRGHALEARIYAEDPAKGFLPSTGKLVHLAPPAESLHVRVDTGVEEGDEISPHYDPMIAKLIVWDINRDRALARMLQALADYRVVGVANNIEFLSRLTACPAFAGADLDTGLIEREKAYLFPADEAVPAEVLQIAALAELLRDAAFADRRAARGADPASPWHARDGWRMNATACRSLLFRHGESERAVEVAYLPGAWRLTVGSSSVVARGELNPRGLLRVELDGTRMDATVIAAAGRRHVFARGRAWQLAAVDPLHHGGEGGGAEGGLMAPMPGKVIALVAAEGAKVEKGAPLLILEAMKMEHTITAPAAGTVKAFRFGVGDQVGDGAELVEFEAAAV
ncbi:MAG TPA: acetyl/propionyl/methylcrotonyl-CoA carboxylase subunit alpha [Thauera aminoaromatica]|uniref:Carbamoyl-phosphate synthase L chain ATP-binding protein n=1 Tax=Thauera aminoaromatica S2 TaxID=1234381 RepID=N6XXV0_THASP|nr:acetyl/propionyl/methylcrotonyl-CoA carboxylase subunit alpha [Thauera aminoaromatica]ENO84095.1 carbamoyl-phosphate synthase L chain ATP-binding protein [Thauera aminoaromatica S2]OPZ05160.1 MAG: Acetyl-/propionyl-coenzyme A carboxylase alpha chain [Alphaproteobacteria bacterium ADurb.BinA305]HPV60391.1 acetyl/propionyl/methylcrotonyl-CoA carboxylase subunit alpha [Thauera aminoaromatica]